MIIEGTKLVCKHLDDQCGIRMFCHYSIGKEYEVIAVQSETAFIVDDLGELYDIPIEHYLPRYFNVIPN